jgi:hypothetical protein
MTNLKNKPLFDVIVEEGIPYAYHESDLYVPSTPRTRELAKEYGVTPDPFRNAVNGELWLDLPFQYTPWWESKFE